MGPVERNQVMVEYWISNTLGSQAAPPQGRISCTHSAPEQQDVRTDQDAGLYCALKIGTFQDFPE